MHKFHHSHYLCLGLEIPSINCLCCADISLWPTCTVFATMGLLPDTQNWGVYMRRECWGTFSPSQRVSDPDMHHGTCVTHVLWCMPRSQTSGFLPLESVAGKRSRHPRCMHNPQFYVSGKRPMDRPFVFIDCDILLWYDHVFSRMIK